MYYSKDIAYIFLNLLPGIIRGPEISVNVFLVLNMAPYSRYSLIVGWFNGSV
jgi:hypothetical protein